MAKILLVDDDSFILDIYSSQLKLAGYSVDIANNANRALEKITNNYPDLLILDLNLDTKKPGPKEGVDVLRKIRQDPKTKNLNVITISNYSEKDYPELSNLNSLGVLRHFLKIENSPEELVKIVKEILK
ncbi:MAG: response regulator [Patescibacteria group bacterium]